MSYVSPSRPVVTVQPGTVVMQAVVTACAMIACADGHVAKKERQIFLRFLRHHGLLERHGRALFLTAFDKAVHDASSLELDEICSLADELRAVAGMHGAPFVAQAAAHVALADGVTWPQEMALLEVIRERIGLGHPQCSYG